jgi:hypothetical protein
MPAIVILALMFFMWIVAMVATNQDGAGEPKKDLPASKRDKAA